MPPSTPSRHPVRARREQPHSLRRIALATDPGAGAGRPGSSGEASARDLPSRAAHPAGRRRLHIVPDVTGDEGSLVAEYGLLVVLGATITMLATKWAAGGAIWELFGAVLDHARSLVGA